MFPHHSWRGGTDRPYFAIKMLTIWKAFSSSFFSTKIALLKLEIYPSNVTSWAIHKKIKSLALEGYHLMWWRFTHPFLSKHIVCLCAHVHVYTHTHPPENRLYQKERDFNFVKKISSFYSLLTLTIATQPPPLPKKTPKTLYPAFNPVFFCNEREAFICWNWDKRPSQQLISISIPDFSSKDILISRATNLAQTVTKDFGIS